MQFTGNPDPTGDFATLSADRVLQAVLLSTCVGYARRRD